MLQQFEDTRNNIRHYAIKEKDYIKVVKLCFEYLKAVSDLPEESIKDDKKFIYYEIALNSKKAGDFESAIKYGLISLNYLDDIDFESSKYVNRLWLLASAYEQIGNRSEAKRLYYECSYLFRKLGEENQRAMIIFNNAKLLKNFKAMRNIIRLYETREMSTTIETYGDMEYSDVLKTFYTELIELYITESKSQEAFRIIYCVKSKSFRKELALKLCA